MLCQLRRAQSQRSPKPGVAYDSFPAGSPVGGLLSTPLQYFSRRGSKFRATILVPVD